ncbi:uncharacterized protein [Phaseolus vulgaris]|uniref:uncharacterized protein n=1 Tax=Phaseolus vulgaris TaxID=3885 RepID=UPI0035CB570B
MGSDVPHEWYKWLSLAEWWHNTTYHNTIRSSPYEVVYGQQPPLYLPYLPGESRIELVDRSLQKREETLKLNKFHMQRAQNRMAQQANKHRSDRTFEIGDMVYAKLHPYRQTSVASQQNAKLAPKNFGHFPIDNKMGAVTYKLQLPSQSKIHNVFHVSQLKQHVRDAVTAISIPKN